MLEDKTMLRNESNINLWIQNHMRTEKMNKFWLNITHLSDGGLFWIGINLLLFIIPNTRPVGYKAFLGMVFQAIIVNFIIKVITDRSRPFEVNPDIKPIGRILKDKSFPSGHTSVAFTSAFIYLQTLPLWFGSITLLIAFLIAFSRIYLGVHFVTDILGGILVAALVVIFVL